MKKTWLFIFRFHNLCNAASDWLIQKINNPIKILCLLSHACVITAEPVKSATRLWSLSLEKRDRRREPDYLRSLVVCISHYSKFQPSCQTRLIPERLVPYLVRDTSYHFLGHIAPSFEMDFNSSVYFYRTHINMFCQDFCVCFFHSLYTISQMLYLHLISWHRFPVIIFVCWFRAANFSYRFLRKSGHAHCSMFFFQQNPPLAFGRTIKHSGWKCHILVFRFLK